MMATRDWQDTAFDPMNPRCPDCGARLTEDSRISSKYYPDQRMTMYVHICRCGAATGYVIKDDFDPSEGYKMHKIIEGGEIPR